MEPCVQLESVDASFEPVGTANGRTRVPPRRYHEGGFGDVSELSSP
jgi:hypothetical protein